MRFSMRVPICLLLFDSRFYQLCLLWTLCQIRDQAVLPFPRLGPVVLLETRRCAC